MLTLVFLVSLVCALGQSQHQCEKVCASIYQPVCGTNRHTYSNMCTLQVAECKARLMHQHLTLLHTGACTSAPTNPPVVGGHASYICNGYCDEEIHMDYLCASNGVTYKSPCEFSNAQCLAAQNHTHLTVRHSGECTNLDVGCSQPCDTKEINPICSNANVTYLNECQLKMMQCRYAHIPSLADRYQVSHDGTCDGTDITHHIKYDCNPFINQAHVAVEGSTAVLFNRCPATHDYVCGTDLRTYVDCGYCQMMAHTGRLGGDNTVEIISEGHCPFGTIG